MFVPKEYQFEGTSAFELPLRVHMSQFSSESDTMALNLLVVILPWNSSLSSVSIFIMSGQKALFRFMTQWLILFQGKLSPFSSPPTHTQVSAGGWSWLHRFQCSDRGCLRQYGGNFYLNSSETNANCKMSDSWIYVGTSDIFNLKSKIVERYVYLETICMFAWFYCNGLKQLVPSKKSSLL